MLMKTDPAQPGSGGFLVPQVPAASARTDVVRKADWRGSWRGADPVDWAESGVQQRQLQQLTTALLLGPCAHEHYDEAA